MAQTSYPFDDDHVNLIQWHTYMVTDPYTNHVPYVDLPVANPDDNIKGEPSHGPLDLVGDPGLDLPTAYRAIQDGNMLFRMRVNPEPTRKDVWTVFPNTNPTVDR